MNVQVKSFIFGVDPFPDWFTNEVVFNRVSVTQKDGALISALVLTKKTNNYAVVGDAILLLPSGMTVMAKVKAAEYL